MIYLCRCTYCGDRIMLKEAEMAKLPLRCPICNSKRSVQEYEPIDGYKDCPPFPAKVEAVVTPKVVEPEPTPEVDYGSYGDMMSAYGDYHD